MPALMFFSLTKFGTEETKHILSTRCGCLAANAVAINPPIDHAIKYFFVYRLCAISSTYSSKYLIDTALVLSRNHAGAIQLIWYPLLNAGIIDFQTSQVAPQPVNNKISFFTIYTVLQRL